ncbi:MAG: ribonuclease P protein component, partial [Dehalococcoidia bacterium]
RNQHIRRRSEFQSVRENGLSRAHPLLVLSAARNGLPYARFGFIVSRRVAGHAVVRNRIRRRLREVARRTPVKPGWDVVFIARKPAPDADFAALQQAVLELERRAGLQAPASMPEASLDASGTAGA